MVQSGIATAKFHNVIDLVKVMEKPMNSLGYEAAGVDVEILGNIQQSCHHKTIMIMMNRTVLPPPPPPFPLSPSPSPSPSSSFSSQDCLCCGCVLCGLWWAEIPTRRETSRPFYLQVQLYIIQLEK